MYGRPGNSTSYYPNTVMPYITRTKLTWTKRCILSFPEKGDLGIAKKNRGVTFTFIEDKIYNAQLRNRIEPEIEKILMNN